MCLLGVLVLFNLGIKCKSVYKGNIIHIKLCPALFEVIGRLSGTEMKLGRPESPLKILLMMTLLNDVKTVGLILGCLCALKLL